MNYSQGRYFYNSYFWCFSRRWRARCGPRAVHLCTTALHCRCNVQNVTHSNTQNTQTRKLEKQALRIRNTLKLSWPHNHRSLQLTAQQHIQGGT